MDIAEKVITAAAAWVLFAFTWSIVVPVFRAVGLAIGVL
jgi:hypothetical protein